MGQLPGDSTGFPEGADERSDTVHRSFQEARSLKRELLEELRAGWEEGEPVPPEQLLDRWPGDAERDPDVASLLFEDYWQRCQRSTPGDEPNFKEYEERFPSQKAALERVQWQHSVAQSLGGGETDPPRGGGSRELALPSAGDDLFDFHLRDELGRGAFARVFLAEQAALADRPVVLKVSAIEGDEARTLAQLQHTHIVPVYSVHEDRKAGLRAVCMPYFGGASLAAVLRVLWEGQDAPRSGAQLVRALAVVENPSPQPPPRNGEGEQDQLPASAPPLRCGEGVGGRGAPTDTARRTRDLLAGFDYVRAGVWLVARLAEALEHAHQRGVLHRDIKPSNILLAADGEPMLLDFNLAQHCRDGQGIASLGGTVAYMAPEHLRALAQRDPDLAARVDHRADIYSLGMVLYEIFTGEGPFGQSASYFPLPVMIEAMAVERSQAAPSLKKRRPDVPWGLESIARKCLAPDPARRYQRAEHLAEDLRRLLEDLPLRHAPELSWRERAGKWARRHPRLTASGTVSAAAALLLVTGATLLMGTRAQLNAAHARIHEAEGAEARERKAEFEAGYQQALCLVNTGSDLRDHADQGLAACEKTLGLYGVLESDDWQAHRDWQRVAPAERRQLAEKVRELLILLARARVHRARGPAAGAGSLREALTLLARAEAVPGLAASAALWEDRAGYLEQLGDRAGSAAAGARAKATPSTGAHDHYWRALKLATTHRLDEAVKELDRALRLNPRHYWSWLQLGVCHDELGEHALAVGDFSACIALWPEFAWGHFNRGRVLEQLGKREEALADYSAALKCDPAFVYGYMNRGLLHGQLGRHAEALADFERAATLGRDDVHLHAGRGLVLEKVGRHAEADRAFATAWERDPHNPHTLLAYGFAVHGRLPEKAGAAFRQVLQGEPRNTRALYGLGMLAAAQARDSKDALGFFTQAIEIDPAFVDARRGRANVRAHLGEWDAARADIDWCVAVEPTGVTLYAAACVYALLAEKCQSTPLAGWSRDRAIGWLQAALARGYGGDRMADDRDLMGIRSHPQFQGLLKRGQGTRGK